MDRCITLLAFEGVQRPGHFKRMKKGEIMFSAAGPYLIELTLLEYFIMGFVSIVIWGVVQMGSAT